MAPPKDTSCIVKTRRFRTENIIRSHTRERDRDRDRERERER
jgi:hypothetical protein